MNLPRRRGFALGIVLLLSVVASVLVGVMLERQLTQSLMVQRQVDRISNHHFERGMAEVLDQWIRSLGARDLREALGEDGLAFALETESGARLSFFLFDGQGTALSDVAGLSGDQRATAVGILARLTKSSGNDLASLTRPVGPVAVCAATASEEVLTAVIGSAAADEGAAALASALVSARDQGKIEPAQLKKLIDDSTFENDEKERLHAVLLATPSLWRFAIVPDSNKPEGERVRYVGWALAGASRESAGAFRRISAILSIEKQVY
jgi:hypothetical protein